MRLTFRVTATALLLQGCGRLGESVVGGEPPRDVAPTFDVVYDVQPFDAPAVDAPRDASPEAAPDVPSIDASDVATDVAPDAAPDAGGCSSARDTCPPSQHCDDDSHTCVEGCRSDEGCTLSGVGGRRYCNTASHACAPCVTDAHCGAGRVCAGNVCAASCAGGGACSVGQMCCAGACVDLTANAAHCGACGRECPASHAAASCTGGRCEVGVCAAPYGDCDGRADNGCETNTFTNAQHCGACGAECPVRPHALSACAVGACRFTCEAGYADCNGRAGDGCEVVVATSASSCGGCGISCTFAHASGVCAASVCALGACDAGFANCDGDASNGCETDTRASAAHCGGCGRACTSGANGVPTCVGGSCVGRCATGFADCDGDVTNGCEVDTRVNAAHCGACGSSCGTRACVAGVCGAPVCDPGFGDCDRDAANGCETILSTSAAHCGACSNACPLEQVCSLGRCVDTCRAPQVLCAGGCSDLSIDPTHCGTCATACPSGQRCVTGACRVMCTASQTQCGASCANTESDPTHCGGCDTVCPSADHASRTCTTGRCGFRCDPGFGDCNGVAADGCETDLARDPARCGSCSTRCAPAHGAALCAAGTCALAMCDPGFGDCNSDPADGCESDLATGAGTCGACENACVSGTSCVSGECAAGARAPLVVSGSHVVSVERASLVGAIGAREVTVSNAVGAFAAGQRVMLHQSQSASGAAGAYEFNTVRAVRGATVTLRDPLAHAFSTDATARAQMVAVGVFSSVTVNAGATLTAPEWNGSHGGILALEVTGAVTVLGRISMDGRGFRGPRHDDRCPYRCAGGAQGESALGVGAASVSNNGGGGGGGQGQDCGAGAGGSYGSAGLAGAGGDCTATTGICGGMCLSAASAGGVNGTDDLRGYLLFGGAGGEGGADEDGAYPGFGGNGGGVIYVRSETLRVSGAVSANGVSGTSGAQSLACAASSGCGMGGGGGGAGGAVRIETEASAELGESVVRALGGGGGVCSCRRTVGPERASPGGAGGAGRIGVRAAVRSGVTSPAFDPN